MSTLGDCLFGTVKLSKNSGLDKHGYSGYGIGFDVCLTISLNGEWSKNVIIFGAHNSSLLHADDRKKISQFLVKIHRID